MTMKYLLLKDSFSLHFLMGLFNTIILSLFHYCMLNLERGYITNVFISSISRARGLPSRPDKNTEKFMKILRLILMQQKNWVTLYHIKVVGVCHKNTVEKRFPGNKKYQVPRPWHKSMPIFARKNKELSVARLR